MSTNLNVSPQTVAKPRFQMRLRERGGAVFAVVDIPFVVLHHRVGRGV